MRFGVLGPVGVWTADGQPVTIPELKVRALLASLLVEEGRPVSAHRLIDDLWGERPPSNPTRALQAKASQLRRALEEAEPGGRGLVVSQAPGYLLAAAPGTVDSGRFAELTARARAGTDPAVRAALLADALALWRGPAFADFAGEPFARAAADRLEEERLGALEDHAEARLRLGEHGALAGALAELITRHPLRERLRSVQLRALYRAGRQSEALAGYEELRARLAEDLGLDPSPELVTLQRAILAQDPTLDADAATEAGARPGTDTEPGTEADAASAPQSAVPASATRPAAAPAPLPAPARATRPVHRLPAPLTELVGRAEAVVEVRKLVETRRLVTLTGPGGVGKTRLATAAADELTGTFPDGVWLIELAGLGGEHAGLAELAEVVCAALGVRDDGAWGVLPQDEQPEVADRLAEALRETRLLLVLDNCEHLVEQAASLVELLLRSAPGLHILTTSQEALALAGETLWSVPPLAPDSAVELFLARAAASPGFTADADGAETVRAVCRRLDGIPLALELAATRVRALGIRELLTRLDDRFRLPGQGQRGAPARQQTLRAMIDWSWELLGEPERTVLRRLAVHAEGCTLQAAEAVCAGGGLAAHDVPDLLVRLVDRSLVVAVSGPHPGDGPRYRLLESVAAYCTDRMREAGELETVRARHLAHHVAFAERAEPALRGPDQHLWLERLDAEAANLRAALDTAVRGADASAALRLVAALSWYWGLRGRLGEARRSLTAALSLDTGAAAAGTEGADTPARTQLRARVGAWHTGISILAGDGADRPGRIEAALAPYEELDDPAGLAQARWFLSHALCGTGGLLEGERLTALALDDFRTLGDRWGTAAALSDRSIQRLLRGDLDGAGRDGTRSAELFREAGDESGRLWTVYPLASLAEIRGDYEHAERLYREGLRKAEHLRLSTLAVDLLSGLGRIALLTGDHDAAREHHEHARRLASEQGFRAGEFNALLGLGLGARREGLLDLAEEHLRGVLEWHRRIGLDDANALVLAELGFVAEQRGDAVAARDRQLAGLAAARTTGDPRALALALEGLAGAEALGGRPRTAALLLGSATAARAAAGAPRPAAERGDADRATVAAQAALGDAAFTAEFTRGQALPPEAALTATGVATPNVTAADA
ncbi:AAA family ATPase [Streptomyces sp. N2-109]|uniref:AAA family ATPase n=1 Tax=Streptomyces gossypii TaxID=2883101 RepID=A0ABT2JNG8_9ACTN|nr:BTAD domain-containing putative transcriptional regulator [Streptomyces gossypii]MCT2589424.1 AAA family ATPase [Streptomyces gossypii]